jgi:hypothetical protein
MNQSTKINLIGCDTIVNSPSINLNYPNGMASIHSIPAGEEWSIPAEVE